eukprot:1328043-Amphidinium_carterae.1
MLCLGTPVEQKRLQKRLQMEAQSESMLSRINKYGTQVQQTKDHSKETRTKCCCTYVSCWWESVVAEQFSVGLFAFD